jgi:hypothetical protein
MAMETTTTAARSSNSGGSSDGGGSSPSETRAMHDFVSLVGQGSSSDEMALEVEQEEEEAVAKQGQAGRGEGGVARDDWFWGGTPGEEHEAPDEEEDGMLVLLTEKEQAAHGVLEGDKKVAATVIAGQYHPHHLVAPPESSFNPDGSMDVRACVCVWDNGRGGDGLTDWLTD